MSAGVDLTREHVVSCRSPEDRFACAQLALDICRAAGMPNHAAWEVGVVAAELGSNIARHGCGGTLQVRLVNAPRPAVEVVATDSGPGIPDVAKALLDGWSQGAKRTPDSPRTGLGGGLGAVKRLMNELQVRSARGEGTTVTARKWLGVAP